MKQLWSIYIGLANIAEGLTRVLSLGTWTTPGFSRAASLRYARWSYKRESKS